MGEPLGPVFLSLNYFLKKKTKKQTNKKKCNYIQPITQQYESTTVQKELL